MGGFRAEVDQMVSVAGILDGVVSELQAEGHGSLDGSSLGQPDAEEALSAFVSNWSHGRSEIAQGVQWLQTGLRGAAEFYLRTDQALASDISASESGDAP